MTEMEKIAETSLLYDFYGQLLTEKQRQVMALYHEENLTLSEIAGEFSISRQAVHDTLKKAEQSLTEYENKLGLVEKFVISTQALEEIEKEGIDLVIMGSHSKDKFSEFLLGSTSKRVLEKTTSSVLVISLFGNKQEKT